MSGPVKPEDIVAKKTAVIPDGVFEVFNSLIASAWDGHRARVLQKDAVRDICEALQLSHNELFASGYLNIEESYRAVGWKVQYDNPVAYAGEDYPPHWIFTKS